MSTQYFISKPQWTSTNNPVMELIPITITEADDELKQLSKKKLKGSIDKFNYTVGDTPEEIMNELSHNWDFWFEPLSCFHMGCICEDCCLEVANAFFNNVESNTKDRKCIS